MSAFALGVFGAENATAQSNVALYGQIDSFIGFNRAIGASNTAYQVGSGDIQTSYWGIKGNEDLGDGLNVIFNLNGYFRANTGAAGAIPGDALFSRDAYVGLQSDAFGTIRLGRNITPYFYSTALFNPLVDSYSYSPMIVQNLGLSVGNVFDPGIIGDASWSNSVLYTTPSMAGLTASLIYELGGQLGTTGQNKWGGNLLYGNGPFAATLAFQQVKFNNVVGDVVSPSALAGFNKQTAAQAGVSYDFQVVKVFAQGQRVMTDVNNSLGSVKHDNGTIGASVPVGQGHVLVSYGYNKTRNIVAAFTRSTIGLAYDYNLSKRTDVYVGYLYDSVRDLSQGNSFGLGVRHTF